jgi:hypothetical protein
MGKRSVAVSRPERILRRYGGPKVREQPDGVAEAEVTAPRMVAPGL